jgi:hypothetical protein
MRGAQHNTATATTTAKRFAIFLASKIRTLKLAEEFYIKSAERAQNPLYKSGGDQNAPADHDRLRRLVRVRSYLRNCGRKWRTTESTSVTH